MFKILNKTEQLDRYRYRIFRLLKRAENLRKKGFDTSYIYGRADRYASAIAEHQGIHRTDREVFGHIKDTTLP